MAYGGLDTTYTMFSPRERLVDAMSSLKHVRETSELSPAEERLWQAEMDRVKAWHSWDLAAKIEDRGVDPWEELARLGLEDADLSDLEDAVAEAAATL